MATVASDRARQASPPRGDYVGSDTRVVCIKIGSSTLTSKGCLALSRIARYGVREWRVGVNVVRKKDANTHFPYSKKRAAYWLTHRAAKKCEIQERTVTVGPL